MFELTSYIGLFVAAFGAATLLPMQSEAVLVGMLLSDRYVVSTLLAVATVGNVLGSALPVEQRYGADGRRDCLRAG